MPHAALLLVCPPAVAAQDAPTALVARAGLDDAFLAASSARVDVEGLSEEPDGCAVDASLDVTDVVLGCVGLQALSAGADGEDLDLDVLELGHGAEAGDDAFALALGLRLYPGGL